MSAPEVCIYEVGPRDVAVRARADGIPLRAYVSTVCGCPYEGEVAPGAVASLTVKLLGLGASEISLGDTIGVGQDVVDLFERGGVTTGVALDRLVDASAWLEREVLRRPLPGRVYRAVLGERARAQGES